MVLRDRLLTVKQTAVRLGYSESTVRRWIAGGQLPALRLGEGEQSPLRVSNAELEEWLEERKLNG
jgi:excisionase family DNA binding protein